ncbi:unnamed protein product [Chironomus riparius]|uniref:Uncharacterized protein n=1 Tax=Chironomus riparius TaxID=315576 RepID=A0A9N9WU89_9DIPT|nr:unnamed protein product [Chironomus riparius]
MSQDQYLLSERNVPNIQSSSFYRRFLNWTGANFSEVDAKIPKWYIMKKLRRISYDTLCCLQEATSFFTRRKNKAQSWSNFYVGLDEYSTERDLSESEIFQHIMNDLVKIVDSCIDNAIPLIVDGKPIHVEPNMSKQPPVYF